MTTSAKKVAIPSLLQQALLSLGDGRVNSMLLLSHAHGEDWKEAFTHSEVNPDFFVYRPKGLHEKLPWDFIDHGVFKKNLRKEYKLSLKGGRTSAL